MQEENTAIYQMRFPQKLWYLLNLQTDSLLWGGTGRTILLNYRTLHGYLQCDNSIFKTTNISSFVRQLNLYGFRKVTSHLQDPLCNSSNPYMHEYVHDYFQYGRPELLNKITRNSLTIRKNFKPKSLYGLSDRCLNITPLQRARRALHIALRRAAQDLLIQDNPKQYGSSTTDCEETTQNYDEETIEFDWIMTQKDSNNGVKISTSVEEQMTNKSILDNNTAFGETQHSSLMDFNDENSQCNDSFPTQFLGMTDANPEQSEQSELLAEFGIDQSQHDDQIITPHLGGNSHSSLNCVLPSVSNDHNEDEDSLAEKDDDYHDREWDQMFNEIMTNKGPNPECGTDLKELYSQISRTIDLLNS